MRHYRRHGPCPCTDRGRRWKEKRWCRPEEKSHRCSQTTASTRQVRSVGQRSKIWGSSILHVHKALHAIDFFIPSNHIWHHTVTNNLYKLIGGIVSYEQVPRNMRGFWSADLQLSTAGLVPCHRYRFSYRCSIIKHDLAYNISINHHMLIYFLQVCICLRLQDMHAKFNNGKLLYLKCKPPGGAAWFLPAVSPWRLLFDRCPYTKGGGRMNLGNRWSCRWRA
jgi:hypothetical protein